MLIGIGLLPPPHKRCECVGTGVSAHLTRVMIVFTTRARQSDVPSMRSSRRSSSRGSIRDYRPRPQPIHESANEFIKRALTFHFSTRRVIKGNRITHLQSTLPSRSASELPSHSLCSLAILALEPIPPTWVILPFIERALFLTRVQAAQGHACDTQPPLPHEPQGSRFD